MSKPIIKVLCFGPATTKLSTFTTQTLPSSPHLGPHSCDLEKRGSWRKGEMFGAWYYCSYFKDAHLQTKIIDRLKLLLPALPFWFLTLLSFILCHRRWIMVFSQPIFLNNSQAPAASNELHFHCIRWQKCPTGSFQRIRMYTLSINIRRHTFLHVYIICICIYFKLDRFLLHSHWPSCRSESLSSSNSLAIPSELPYIYVLLKTKLSSQTSWPMPGRCWPNHQVPCLHKTYKCTQSTGPRVRGVCETKDFLLLFQGKKTSSTSSTPTRQCETWHSGFPSSARLEPRQAMPSSLPLEIGSKVRQNLWALIYCMQ